MRPIPDITPLVEMADEEFRAQLELLRTRATWLNEFWTRIYGPNEAMVPLLEALDELEREWEAE